MFVGPFGAGLAAKRFAASAVWNVLFGSAYFAMYRQKRAALVSALLVVSHWFLDLAAGRWGLMGLVAFLLVIQVANLFGPPPPNVAAIAWAGQAQWLLVLWALWLDRHREYRGTA